MFTKMTLSGVALAFFALASPALSSTTACNTFQAGAVTGDLSGTNSGCAILSQNNPNSAADVNADSPFGVTTWVAVAGLSGTGLPDGGVTVGTYNIGANFFDTYDQALLVLKAGGAQTIPPNAIAYLLTALDGTTGSWYSPFLNANEVAQALSHGLLFGHVGPPRETSPVPLPGAVWLLFAALSSLGVFGWVKRRATA